MLRCSVRFTFFLYNFRFIKFVWHMEGWKWSLIRSFDRGTFTCIGSSALFHARGLGCWVADRPLRNSSTNAHNTKNCGNLYNAMNYGISIGTKIFLFWIEICNIVVLDTKSWETVGILILKQDRPLMIWWPDLRMWLTLPNNIFGLDTKSSTTLAEFRARLNNDNFTGCQCMNCI